MKKLQTTTPSTLLTGSDKTTVSPTATVTSAVPSVTTRGPTSIVVVSLRLPTVAVMATLQAYILTNSLHDTYVSAARTSPVLSTLAISGLLLCQTIVMPDMVLPSVA